MLKFFVSCLSTEFSKEMNSIEVCFSRTISRLKVTYMSMTLATSLVVLFNCYITADILTKFLQPSF